MKIALTVIFIFALCFISVISCQSVNSSNTTTTTTTTATASTTSTTLPGATVSVDIASFAFSPSSLTITAETTVIWTNNDSTTHTVTSTTGPASFDSGNKLHGETYSHKFTTVGTYGYHCSIHTSMTGTIIVE